MTKPSFPVPILRYRNVAIDLPSWEGERSLVRGLDLDVFPNEIVALVGESGSGKTLTALSVLGLLPKGASFRADIATVNGKDITRLTNRGWRDLRGPDVGIVFQEPLSSLNPVMTIGDQIGEVLLYKKGLARKARGDRSAELLDLMGIPDPRRVLGEYPHQLSGGMRQRVMLAIAMAGEPRLLIADEPTTALDNAIQNQVLELLVETAARTHIGLLFITHDLSIVAQIADRVAVMKDGSLVESAPVGVVFAQPHHTYTRRLVSLAPRIPSIVRYGPPAEHTEPAAQGAKAEVPLLEVRDVVKRYSTQGAFFAPVSGPLALDRVSASIWPGKTLGLVGQSGSGKSSLARVITGLTDLDSGRVLFEGVHLFSESGKEATRRGRDIQMIFQDPFSSLNPRMKIAGIVTEPMAAHGLLVGKSVQDAAVELLETVGLPADFARRYPHELSGGQRQRVGIARSLGLRPKLLVCDEPISALDVSVQAEISRCSRHCSPYLA